MKDIKIVPTIEKGLKVELSTHYSNDSLVFERTKHKETGKFVYCNIHPGNTPDAGRFLRFGANSKWKARVDSFVERENCIKCYVSLVGETPIETEKREFRIPGTDIVRGGEIEVLVLKSKNEDGNFILPDNRNPGIKIYFQVPYWDEEQNQKRDNPNCIGKMRAVVDYINVTAPVEGKPRVYNVRIILQGEPISRHIFNQFWTSRVYRMAIDRTVKVNPSMMNLQITEDGCVYRVYVNLDIKRLEYKESKNYLVGNSFSTADIFITRGEVNDRNKEVFLYGIISKFVKKDQETAA